MFFYLIPNISQARWYKTVVLDPGHGGFEKGAVRGKVLEKELNLKVSHYVRELLQKKGIKVVMTRKKDKYVSLDRRARISNKYRNAIFVSIHFNGHVSKKPKGIET